MARAGRIVAMRRAAIFAVLACAALSAPAADKPRVVALGGALTEIVFALGRGEQLAGVDSTSTYPAEATRLPQAGYVRTLSAEGILSLKPALILATSEAGPPTVLEQLRASGVRIITVEEKHTLENVKEKIAAVGTALECPAEAASLLAQIENDVAQLESRRAGMPEKPRALFLMNHGALSAAGKDTAADAVLTLAGAVNCVTEYSRYKPLTAEAAVAASPDVIVTTTRTLQAAGGLDALLKTPGLALTPAGRNRRIVALDDLALLGFGPRTPKTILDLAEQLHRAK